MRLFASKVTSIAHESVRALLAAGEIEAESPKEVEADVEAVLKHYLTQEREVNERTKDLLEKTGRGNGDYGRVRVQVAETAGIKVGDEMLDYLLDQVVEMFQNSHHVDEIYGEDVALRRRMAPVFKKHMTDDDLDAEVRAQLRHVREGDRTWDVEYARALDQVKRKKGMS